jgi:hypothetical protein
MYGFKFSHKDGKFFAVSETNNVNYTCSQGADMFVRGVNDGVSMKIQYSAIAIDTLQQFKDEVIDMWEGDNGIGY